MSKLAPKIGKQAFFEPEISTTPDKSFQPFISNMFFY
jgi:hypothetical protein